MKGKEALAASRRREALAIAELAQIKEELRDRTDEVMDLRKQLAGVEQFRTRIAELEHDVAKRSSRKLRRTKKKVNELSSEVKTLRTDEKERQKMWGKAFQSWLDMYQQLHPTASGTEAIEAFGVKVGGKDFTLNPDGGHYKGMPTEIAKTIQRARGQR